MAVRSGVRGAVHTRTIFSGLDPSEDTPVHEPGFSFDGRYTHAIRVATLHATRSDHFLPACTVHHSHSDRAYVLVPEVKDSARIYVHRGVSSTLVTLASCGGLHETRTNSFKLDFNRVTFNCF